MNECKILPRTEYFSQLYQHLTKFQIPILIIDGVADTKKLTQLPCY
jgi:hypothetical protein